MATENKRIMSLIPASLLPDLIEEVKEHIKEEEAAKKEANSSTGLQSYIKAKQEGSSSNVSGMEGKKL